MELSSQCDSTQARRRRRHCCCCCGGGGGAGGGDCGCRCGCCYSNSTGSRVLAALVIAAAVPAAVGVM